jgi:hypothetical protein
MPRKLENAHALGFSDWLMICDLHMLYGISYCCTAFVGWFQTSRHSVFFFGKNVATASDAKEGEKKRSPILKKRSHHTPIAIIVRRGFCLSESLWWLLESGKQLLLIIGSLCGNGSQVTFVLLLCSWGG